MWTLNFFFSNSRENNDTEGEDLQPRHCPALLTGSFTVKSKRKLRALGQKVLHFLNILTFSSEVLQAFTLAGLQPVMIQFCWVQTDLHLFQAPWGYFYSILVSPLLSSSLLSAPLLSSPLLFSPLLSILSCPVLSCPSPVQSSLLYFCFPVITGALELSFHPRGALDEGFFIPP